MRTVSSAETIEDDLSRQVHRVPSARPATFDRDYLLPAPSANLRGCKRAELEYDQGFAMQNRVLARLQ